MFPLSPIATRTMTFLALVLVYWRWHQHQIHELAQARRALLQQKQLLSDS